MSERGYDLYEVDGWQPRVSVVSNWRQTSAVAALAAVLERGFNPAIQAVVEGNPGIGSSSAAPGTATYRELAPEDLRISVRSAAPSIVVVRNAWDPDWSATVDGSPAPVLRADYLLQGIPVNPIEWWDAHWIQDRIDSKIGPKTGEGEPAAAAGQSPGARGAASAAARPEVSRGATARARKLSRGVATARRHRARP